MFELKIFYKLFPSFKTMGAIKDVKQNFELTNISASRQNIKNLVGNNLCGKYACKFSSL